MDRLDELAKFIWNKPFSEVSEQEAASAAQQYPYFSAAQLLYLQKLDTASEAYRQQYQKAILYYHNPVAFPSFLNTFVHKASPQNNEIEKQPLAHDDTGTTAFEKDTIAQASTDHDTKKDHSYTDKGKEKTTGDELTFEPFHTVDYFASQGIKPVADEMPQDKFGKQLKSFTDWLKTMKKLPATEAASKDLGTEKKVENLAAHSVEDASVITESMAEVWLKQGNKEKALLTYHKLSLQNPAKSAYFAAKIKSINEQIQ